MNLQKIIIFSTLLLDIVGLSIMIPAFPELKMYYGIGDFQVTLGLTIYALCSFLSAPLLGQLSDKFGRKGTLLSCITGTFFSYLLLLITQQYWIFLLSRALNGITGGNISILQAILTDISPTPEAKSKHFGLMGAFFGLGFIVGPLLGAILLKFGSVTSIFWFGAIFSLIELILILTHFSNTNHPQRDRTLTYSSFHVLAKYIRKPAMRNILISLFFLGVGGFIINASMSLYMNGVFGTTGEEYGYYLAIAGIIGAINMGYLIPKFWTKKFSHKSLIIISHVALIIGYALVGLSHSIGLFLILFYITAMLSGMYMPVYNIAIMSKAQPNEIGEVSGMLGGAQSLFMFVGPLIGGTLLSTGVNIYIGAVICFIISAVVMVGYVARSE